MRRELKALYDSSEFARENLSFYETLLLIFEKWGVPRDAYYLEKEIEESVLLKIKEDLKRAVSGEPLGYILGKIPFFEDDYFVEEEVLIPRRDSEVAVITAIDNLPKNAHFLDICTGTGCLGISTLKKRPDTRATLLDISEKAVSLALKNAENLGVRDRCEVLKFDFLKDDLSVLGDFDAVIMNPPYITASEMETLPQNVKREPTLALFGGEDGLDFYRRAKECIPDGVTLIFEIGREQGDALMELFGRGEIIKDMTGSDRVFLKKQNKFERI